MTNSLPTPLTRHITRLFRAAMRAGLEVDRDWYATAYARCDALALQYGVPVSVVAGIVSALSPRMEWEANMRIAERMLASAGTLASGALGGNLRKAREIHAGADPVATLNADKTVNFYLAIVTRGADGIVIDRHAIDVATNTRHTDTTRPTMTPKRYAAYAACYRRAAIILSDEFGPVTPSEVQAVTWEAWRLEHKGRRA